MTLQCTMLPAFLMFLCFSLGSTSQDDPACLLQLGKQESIISGLTALSETDPGMVSVPSSLLHSESLIRELQSPLNGQMVTAALATALGVAVSFLLAGSMMPRSPQIFVSIFVIAVYILLSVTIDLLILFQKKKVVAGGNTYQFNPTCSVILTEVIKLVLSLVIYTSNQVKDGKSLMPEGLSFTDFWLFLLPALFFTANNIMVFVAIGGNDASAFGVFRDTMILWTALIWKVVFKAPLGAVRLSGIAVIFSGLVVNRVGSISSASFSWAFLLVMLMTVTNATGSVFNEYALKWNKAVDINLQNMILYALCAIFSVFTLVFQSPRHLSSATAFFEGFTNWTVLMVVLQASAGMIVSRLLKYTDAVYKSIGTCLRGPTLVLIAPVLLGSPTDLISVVSAFIVAGGCLVYLTQGPLSVSIKKAEDSKNAEQTSEAQTPPGMPPKP